MMHAGSFKLSYIGYNRGFTVAHIHTQALDRDWITVVVQGEMIGV